MANVKRVEIGKYSRYLLEFYLKFNRKYFGGRLPTQCAVGWGVFKDKLGVQRFDEVTRPDKAGRWKATKDYPIILIAASLKKFPSIALLTLLHEMCHLALPNQVYHGPKFQAEMTRLAQRGAFKNLW